MADVKLIRMSSGEDVIATVVKKETAFISIKDAIVAIPTSQGKIGFAPWSPLISKQNPVIPVSVNFVVYIADADSAILEQYSSMFGHIVAPTQRLII